MIRIQDREIKNIASRKVTVLRTYKGEIKRTNAGVVTGYPLSFITIGITLTITDTKDEVRKVQQLLLSADKISVQCDYNGVDFLGDFSMTNHNVEELRDKTESKSTITVDLVSHGTAITKPDGTKFKVYYGSSNATASFGEIITLPVAAAGYTLDGATLPNRKIMVLGDITLTPPVS